MKWILAALAATALVLAPAARAKEIEQAEVCGADGCIEVADEGDRATIVDGGPPRTPPAEAPFYAVRLVIDTGGGHVERLDTFAVPSRHALRGADGTWMVMPKTLATVVERYARRLRPLPASELVGAAPAPVAAAPAGDGVLWPEGVLVALALLGVGVLVVRRTRGARRWRPASG